MNSKSASEKNTRNIVSIFKHIIITFLFILLLYICISILVDMNNPVPLPGPPSQEVKELLQNETFYFRMSDKIYQVKGFSRNAEVVNNVKDDENYFSIEYVWEPRKREDGTYDSCYTHVFPAIHNRSAWDWCLVKERFSFGFGKKEGFNAISYIYGYDHKTEKSFLLTKLKWFLYTE